MNKLIYTGLIVCICNIAIYQYQKPILEFISTLIYYENCKPITKSNEYLLISNQIVTQQGVIQGAIHVKGDKIYDIIKTENLDIIKYKNLNKHQYDNYIISPGLIDIHVHLNEPGRETWERIESGTQAAAVGGITTIIDMPLNSLPPVTNAPLAKLKIMFLKRNSYVNAGIWGGIIPDNLDEIEEMSKYVIGFKSFMCPSGTEFKHVNGDQIGQAIKILKRLGKPYIIHAELISDIKMNNGDVTSYETYLRSRPVKFEREAIKLLISILEEQSHIPYKKGFVLHIAHVSDYESLNLLHVAKEIKGLPISFETCPHYLVFSSEQIKDTKLKCAPPIKDNNNRMKLINYIRNNKIIIGSDHSPTIPENKLLIENDFINAWGGISGLQYVLPSIWTVLTDNDINDLNLFSNITSKYPAELLGLKHKIGIIGINADADFVIWDKDNYADTSVKNCRHQWKELSPYIDMNLKGKVKATFVKGIKIFEDNDKISKKPCKANIEVYGFGNWAKVHLGIYNFLKPILFPHLYLLDENLT